MIGANNKGEVAVNINPEHVDILSDIAATIFKQVEQGIDSNHAAIAQSIAENLEKVYRLGQLSSDSIGRLARHLHSIAASRNEDAYHWVKLTDSEREKFKSEAKQVLASDIPNRADVKQVATLIAAELVGHEGIRGVSTDGKHVFVFVTSLEAYVSANRVIEGVPVIAVKPRN